MTKLARTKAAKTTSERIEKLLDDGSKEFEELVGQRLHDLLIEQDIASLRQKRGWSQSKLAARAGVSQPFIAKLESGNFKNIELKTLVRIAAALDASLEINMIGRHEHPNILARSKASSRLNT
ncbi:MAG: helix-turn-helix transcriptional regulator [Acidobacteria bacterium]|nr:helix-turn-helix transcriptional regulator [Acidobacteriota bacterium]